MSEQITPRFEDDEIINGIPVHVRSSNAMEAPSTPDGQPLIEMPESMREDLPATEEPPRDTMYGGYTGVRVGEMGRRINDLHAAGRHDEANALTDRLDSTPRL
jgi:hypothetical protein